LLEFLRNLTPQILLLACVLYLAVQLDFNRISFRWEDLKLSLALLSCAGILLASILANTLRLFEAFVSENPALDLAAKPIFAGGGNWWHKIRELSGAVWKHNKKGLASGLAVLLVAYSGLIPVAMMAAQHARALLVGLYGVTWGLKVGHFTGDRVACSGRQCGRPRHLLLAG
jgi:hypothetical protein